MMDFFKEQHDRLMSVKPADVSHENCNICTPTPVGQENSIEGGDMSKSYTEEEFTAAVLEAVTPVKAELDKLRTSQAQVEIDAAITAAVETVEAKVAQLETELDAAKVEAAAIEQKFNDTVVILLAEAEEKAEAELRESKRDERRAAVKAATALADDYIDSKLDRWVAMSDEDFAAIVEDWKAAGVKPAATQDAATAGKEGSGLDAAADTAMNNTRTEGTQDLSDAKLVFGAHLSGTDIRKIF
jgi:hypothetical protein